MQINKDIIKSWLKHIRFCQFIETDFLVSKNWYLKDNIETKTLINYFNTNFSLKYDFNDIYDYSIDLVANSTKDSSIYFAITTIYDLKRVYLDTLQILLVSITLFKRKDTQIFLALPIINEALKLRIENFIIELNKFLKKEGFYFHINSYFDMKYNSVIISSLISYIPNAKDNENFLQTLQVLNYFNKLDDFEKNIEEQNKKTKVDVQNDINLVDKEFFINHFETFKSYKNGNIDKDILKDSVNKGLNYDRFSMIERIFDYELEISILDFILKNSPELENKNRDILLKAKKLIQKYG